MLGAFQIMWNIKSWPGYTRELVWMRKRWYILCLGVKCKRDTTSFSRNLSSKIEALQVDICKYVTVGTSNAFYINIICSIYIYTTDSLILRRSAPGVFRHDIYLWFDYPWSRIPGGKDMAIAFDQVRTIVWCDSWRLCSTSKSLIRENRSRKHHDTWCGLICCRYAIKPHGFYQGYRSFF